MLRCILVVCFWSMAVLAQAAQLESSPLRLKQLKVGSQVFSNITIVGANATDLYFTHSKGISNVKLKYLEPALQKEFHFDSEAAAEAERQQVEEDAKFQQSVAEAIAAKAAAAAAAAVALKAIRTSEDSVSDPVSEQSLLGKQGPKLEVEKWIDEEPVLTNKSVLVMFWMPWSIPCRKAIPQLNAWQKKFADRLQVVGLTTASVADVQAVSEPKVEFHCAVDSKAKLQGELAVTSVPQVLLLDPKGVVLYLGHPAALTEKLLEAILVKPAE